MNRLLLATIILLAAVGTGASAAGAPCSSALSAAIPARDPQSPGGREFSSYLASLDDDEREAAIAHQLLAGNIPQFLRAPAPVALDPQPAASRSTRVVVCVLPDYLAIGTDADFFLVPMRLRTALSIAEKFHFLLPTRRMVDAIYAQAPIHLQPQPLPASDTMRSTAYYWHHSELIVAQRLSMSEPLGTLTAGDKKDLVLTNRLREQPARVAIYGWHRPDGRPIQPLSTFHGARYADYSHGVRLVSGTAFVDGQARSLLALLQEPRLTGFFSDEGGLGDIPELLETLQDSQLARDVHRSAH